MQQEDASNPPPAYRADLTVDTIPDRPDVRDCLADTSEAADSPDPIDPTPRLTIEIEADPTLGYASIQNAVPVVRSIAVINGTEETLEDVDVLITCNPRFAQGKKLRFDRIGAGERRVLSPLDLVPDHTYLSELSESVQAFVRAQAVSDRKLVGSVEQPIRILAYDQWAGTRALPELLAAFCMPNNPAVDVLVGKASALLRAEHPDLSMNGYQSKSREVVWRQVSALYSAICAEGLQYAEPPASFGSDGQRIRTADRILDGRVATCLDLAMLFASCLEQAGLRSVVLLKEGHAWIGVWLHEACFGHPLIDDVQAVRKRVASGEFLVFETTGVALHHSRRPSLRGALEQGQAHLQEEGSFRYAVDIHRARELQIKPLPSKPSSLQRGPAPTEVETPLAIEPAPVLPPFDPEVLTEIDHAAADTPDGRLAKWKSSLLDLSLRNRLLNFKPTKASLQFVTPDLPRLEDELASGVEFKLRPLPQLMEGTDPRVAQVHIDRGGRNPLDEVAPEALKKHELIARVGADAIDAHLLSIFSGARTGLEEGGANTLYLAIGFLRWTEAEQSDVTHLAPILLLPVSLQRQSVRSGFRLSRHDDEAIVNPTLLQLLRRSFELSIPGVEVLPTDDKGVDVVKVLQAFRLAVRDIPKWEVLDQAHLGLFSFTKYLMWKDLQDRTQALMANRVVKHLIEKPGEAFERDPQEMSFDRLDVSHRPQDLPTPMLADSSQLKAICLVDAGCDLVLEGPPGTGKSQTITNLIAHTLAKGRTVLFVSEKMAALEVVQRRLTEIGLGPFCLELHSAKAKKTEVLQQLGQSLDLQGQATADEWVREADRLGHLRGELNELVEALHREASNGLSVFAAIGTAIGHAGEPASAMPWAEPTVHSRADLDALRETARRMSAHLVELGPLRGDALALVGQDAWSSGWEDELLQAVRGLDASIETFSATLAPVSTTFGTELAGLSMAGYARVDELADVVLAAPGVPEGVARSAHDPGARSVLDKTAHHGKARAQHWQRLAATWAPRLADAQESALGARWRQAKGSWWPKSLLAKRTIRAELSVCRVDGKRPSEADIEAMLAPLAELNREDAQLAALQADAQRLLDHAWSGVQTDWQGVTDHGAWAARFADAVLMMAGADPAVADTVRARLEPLVGANRRLLAPDAVVGKALLAYRDAWQEVNRRLAAVDALARPLEPLPGADDANGALARMRGHLAAWSQAKRLLHSWCLWRQVRGQAIAQGLQGLVRSLESGAVDAAQLGEHFEYSYRQWWVKKAIDADPVLRTFSTADHDRKIREFRAADERFQALSQQYIVALLSGKVPAATGLAVGGDSELGRLRRELQKQRRHMPVRQLVRGLPTLLGKLKPCLLMSPLSVAQYLDAGHTQFDLVVFDEASQISVWDAVGAIARGRQLVVVGDPKQLPPTNFFIKSAGSEQDSGTLEDVQDLESILDECLGAGMRSRSLQWHYRSRHESLITFSNVSYYESNLITFPSPVTDDVAVRFERVDGVYDRGGSRTNRAEADAIVAGIERHFLSARTKAKTLGVVTFNEPQKSLIETLLDARRRANPELDRALAASSKEDLFIKNLENVQGDERDVIFFSITYGVDASGRMAMNFGPLNGEGGHRRLNVAVSRAREAVVVYSSLMPEQIDLARVRSAGVRDLKHYLEFALRGPRALIEQKMPTGMAPDSPFEVAVIAELRNRGWTVHPQVGSSGYRVDLGIVDPRAPGRYLLGVECDGRTYHSGATARDRDRLRQIVLEGLGWRIHRIWSTDWWRDPQREIDKLVGLLERVLAEEVAGEEPEEQAEQQEQAERQAEEQPEERSGEAAAAGEIPAGMGAADEEAATVAAVGSNAGAAGDGSAERAEEFAKAATPASPQSLPMYSPATLRGGSPGAFYDAVSDALLSRELRILIEAEGPIEEAQLFRRVARAWGLERTGTRIVERLQNLLPRECKRTRERHGEKGERVFHWPAGLDKDTWTGFRVGGADPASKRGIDQLCVQEIVNGLLYVLDQAGVSPKQDVARSVCRLVGMARVTSGAEERAEVALRRAVRAKVIVAEGGVIRRVAG